MGRISGTLIQPFSTYTLLRGRDPHYCSYVLMVNSFLVRYSMYIDVRALVEVVEGEGAWPAHTVYYTCISMYSLTDTERWGTTVLPVRSTD
jgi:hypothetical protein